MHTLFALSRFYPYWAFPLAILFAELGWYFRRKKSGGQYYCWALVSVLAVTTIMWIGFRGDMNSDLWVRSFFLGG